MLQPFRSAERLDSLRLKGAPNSAQGNALGKGGRLEQP